MEASYTEVLIMNVMFQELRHYLQCQHSILEYWLESWLLHFDPVPTNKPGKGAADGSRPWVPATDVETKKLFLAPLGE